MPKTETISLFKSPFSGTYWKKALSEPKNLRILVVVSLLSALHIVVGSLFFTVGENLKVLFTFIPASLTAFIGGPVLALFSGFICDILGFLVHPSGPYFPGYTLSSMLGSLIYALFLYRSRISVLRLFFAKLCVNLFVNVGFGSLWSAMIMGKAYYYYFAKSIVKNSILLPLETVILIAVFQLMLPVMAQNGLAPKQPSKRIPFL